MLDRSHGKFESIEEDELKCVDEKIQYIVFGFVRDAQNLWINQSCPSSSCHTIYNNNDEEEEEDEEEESEEVSSGSHKENEINDINVIHVDIKNNNTNNGETSSLEVISCINSCTKPTEFNKIPEGIAYVVVTYYHDKLIKNTNILYQSWSDLDSFSLNNEQQINIRSFYNNLIDLGYNRKRLPKYEMIRYFFGTSNDMNRALNKWKGSIDTYCYYKLGDITDEEIKQCLFTISKSCHFCGYHSMDNKPSPVFVLNYENWDWNAFGDISHVIKASFYICCWMTDNIQAINNGITLMINCKGIRFHHIKRAMTVLRAVQKSLALRTNHVFFCNLPSLAKNSMKLFLKIYPKHIQERIHICSNTDSLFDILSHDQIPQIFGGSLNRNNGQNNNGENIPCLGTILSSYIYIKDFKHFQIDDDDYYDDDDDDDNEDEEDSDDDNDLDQNYNHNDISDQREDEEEEEEDDSDY